MKKKIIAVISVVVAAVAVILAISHLTTGTNPFLVGPWLASDQKILNRWVDERILEADKDNRPLLPVIKEFKDLIEGDPELLMLFTQMFEEISAKPEFRNDPTGKPQVRDYRHMLRVLNHIMTTAPGFNKTGLVGFPINAILNWPMGTRAGTAAFLNEKVNRQLKKILNHWAVFLAQRNPAMY